MVRLTKNIGPITITVEGETLMEAFEQMSMSEECFEPCPIPGASDYKLRVRTVEKDKEEYTYYELSSAIFENGKYKGNARLSLSQYNKPRLGWLYPQRRDKEKKNLPNRGWDLWEGNNNKAQETTKPAAKATGKSKKDEDIPV